MRGRIKKIILFSIVLTVWGLINAKLQIIVVPENDNMVQRQIDYITIGTVFAGFSFTSLGLLLGMSSEKLIEKIKNTKIMMDKVQRIITSIIFFMLSVVTSLIIIMGLDQSLIVNKSVLALVDNAIYLLSLGYLIAGIVFFIYSAVELFDLIKRIYASNVDSNEEIIKKAQQQLERNRQVKNESEDDLDN